MAGRRANYILFDEFAEKTFIPPACMYRLELVAEIAYAEIYGPRLNYSFAEYLELLREEFERVTG